MSCKIEPAIWSCDIGQLVPYFDRFQLMITWMSIVKEVHGHFQPTVWSLAALLRDCVVVTAVVRTRPRAIPLAMITMRKTTHRFPFLFYMTTGPRSCHLQLSERSTKTTEGQ